MREQRTIVAKMSLLLVVILVLGGCARTKMVRINSDPSGATIYLNNVESGPTPLTKELSFKKGKEFVATAKKEGYKEEKIIIGLKPRDKKEYHIDLERCSKTVRITSDPSMATIYLNGVESGIAPLTKELLFEKNKEFEVIAKKEGYKEGKTIIGLEPHDKTEYHVNLEKIEIVSIELVSFEPQLTDEGVKLAIIHKPTLAYLEVIERSPNVESVTRVTNNEDKTLHIGPPILSPVENILVYRVFVKEKDGSSYSNIWRETIGSPGKTRVTYGKWQDSFPSFTPDGKYLVFSSNRTSPNPTLWRIKVEGGGGIAKITHTLAEDFSPCVSPTGNLITYASNPPGVDESQIWTVSMDGSLPTQLREGESPQISPDGKKILFVRKAQDSGRTQIWLMNIDGSGETQLTQNLDYDTIHPEWSLDGKWIVFASNEGFDAKKNRNYDIWLMASDGSNKTQLTTNGSWDDSPSWDHTGKIIYFRSNRGGLWNIWRFKPAMPLK